MPATLFALAAFFTSPRVLAADDTSPASDPTEDLAVYGAVGYSVAEDLRLRALQWTPAQLEAFITGLRASYDGTAYPVDEKTQAGVAAVARQIDQLKTGGDPAASDGDADQLLDQMRRQFGLRQTDRGLLFRVTKSGSGPRPGPDDIVTISYDCASLDAPKGVPGLAAKNTRLKVGDLMPGLAEGVQMLALEGAVMLFVPPTLSFGNGAWPAGVKPGTPLMFTLHLHDIEPADRTP